MSSGNGRGLWGLGAPDEGKGKRERERGGEVGVGKPCRLNRPGGGSVDRGEGRGAHGGRSQSGGYEWTNWVRQQPAVH